MKQSYEGKGKSYEDVKLRAILAVLETVGIRVEEDNDKITVLKDGVKLATLEISL